MQKSDPFGGARPIDSSIAAERRQKILEEKVSALENPMAYISFAHFCRRSKRRVVKPRRRLAMKRWLLF